VRIPITAGHSRMLSSQLAADIRWGGLGLREARVLMIDPEKMEYGAKNLLLMPMIWAVGVIPTKVAVLNLYLAVFTVHHKTRIICYVTGAIFVAGQVGVFIAGCLICIPLDYLWNSQIHGHCGNINAWYHWGRVTNGVTDVVMLILPISPVVRLRMSWRLKAGVLVTFLLGSL
jgi:hypothetical protein